MGMFDDVDVSVECPECGALVDGFQSKDGPCLLDRLEPVEVDHCYSACSGCGAWVDLRITDKALIAKQLAEEEMSRSLLQIYERKGFDYWWDVSSEKKGSR